MCVLLYWSARKLKQLLTHNKDDLEQFLRQNTSILKLLHDLTRNVSFCIVFHPFDKEGCIRLISFFMFSFLLLFNVTACTEERNELLDLTTLCTSCSQHLDAFLCSVL